LIPRPGGTTVFEPDTELARDVRAAEGAISRILSQPPPPDVRVLSIPSVFDLPLMPDGRVIQGAQDACPVPVPHPNLPYAEEFRDHIVRFLDHDQPATCPAWHLAARPLFLPFTAPPTTA
jgi:hypothetical protein